MVNEPAMKIAITALNPAGLSDRYGVRTTLNNGDSASAEALSAVIIDQYRGGLSESQGRDE
jgi:hypothetical protein